MKRKVIQVVITILAIAACVFTFAACTSRSDGGDPDSLDPGSSINGTYYFYANGSYDRSDYIRIDGESWSDKMGMTGFIELDGASISLKYKAPAIAGLPETQPLTYYGGTIGNGVFKEECYMGIPLADNNIKYYCKDGRTPSDLPSGGNTGNDDPSNPVDPSDTKRTVTFDANGGYTSTSIMQFNVGATMQNMPTPTRTGYTFAGWKDSSGKVYDGASTMPNNNITLIAQWKRIRSEYSDTYVTFSPATEGTKNILTQIEYGSDVDKMLYVELTSDDLGGPSKVGTRNNFTLKTVDGMSYALKTGYSWIWYEGDFNTPNGAQRFTLNYGSNFQFVTIGDGSGVVLQTYLVDIYVKQDYYVNLYSDLDAITPYERVRVIDGDYFSAVNHTKQVIDFTFDKHVSKTQALFEDAIIEDYDYTKPVTKDHKLYQTFKPKKLAAELNGGTLDGEITVTPYAKEQELPIPEKEGYDFIGWKFGDKYFTDIEGNSGVNYLNAVNGKENLTASFEPKHFYWYNDGDELKTSVATPIISYKDAEKTEINKIAYKYNDTTLTNDNTFIADKSATVTAEKEGYTFVGWYDGDTQLSTNTNYTFTVPKTEFTYTRRWTYYTLTTDRNITSGGSVTNYREQKITAGESVTITANTYSGYTFLGWYDGYTQLTDRLNYTFTMPEKNITYTAKWTNCPVAFEKNIAAAGSINVPSTTTIGQSVTVTATTNNGYTWLGWYNGNALLTVSTSYTFTLTDASAIYTARWAEYKLTTVASDANAGYVPNYFDRRITAGQSITVTATTNNGYTFVGWYDGNRELTKQLSYTFTMPSSSVTYTAKWCKVTVVSDNTTAGTVSSLNSTYKTGDSTTVTASTKVGYTFVGWYDGATRKTTELSYTFTMPSSNVTYTAKWCKVTVVSDNTTAGTVSSLNSTYKTGDSATVTASTKVGYTFVGWYDGNRELAKQLSYTFTMPSSNVTYTAKWCKVTVVSDNTTAGTVSSLNSTYKTGDSATVTASTKVGYTFVGWYEGTTRKTTELSYTFTMPSSNVTYTAKWCKVTVVSDNTTAGTVSSLNGTYNTGDSVTVAASTKVGYTFVGWFDGATRKTTELSYTFTMPSANVTYTAKWIICPVTLEQNKPVAGTVSMPSTTVIGQSVTVTATINCGYAFVGWYNGAKLLTDAASYSFIMSTENVTFTAVWKDSPDSLAELFEYTYNNSIYTITGLKNKSVNAVTIPDYIGCIGYDSFARSDLTSITIPNSVTSIESSAFYNCYRLTSITIPNSVTSIGSGAFSYCGSLTSITIGNSVTSIGSMAFSPCGSLTSITVESGNTKYHSAGNCLIETASKTLVLGCKNSVIPTDGSVTSIGEWAFYNCSLTSITIPDSVTSIGEYAFYNCSLMSITIPDSVTSIGEYAFRNCNMLFQIENGVYYVDKWAIDFDTCVTIVTLKENTMGIGEKAFYDCSGLTSIKIPNSVTNIGNCAFYDCSGLTSVTIGNSVTSIGSYAFFGCDGLTSIYYTGDIKSWCEISGLNTLMYRGASSKTLYINGSEITGSLVIPTGVTSIGDSAFIGCSSLTSITIPNSVTSIGSRAFFYCDGLTSVTIGNSVTSIGNDAFYLCSSLTSIKYNGTKAQWRAISKGSSWNSSTGNYTVTCTDGTLSKSES